MVRRRVRNCYTAGSPSSALNRQPCSGAGRPGLSRGVPPRRVSVVSTVSVERLLMAAGQDDGNLLCVGGGGIAVGAWPCWEFPVGTLLARRAPQGSRRCGSNVCKVGMRREGGRAEVQADEGGCIASVPFCLGRLRGRRSRRDGRSSHVAVCVVSCVALGQSHGLRRRLWCWTSPSQTAVRGGGRSPRAVRTRPPSGCRR